MAEHKPVRTAIVGCGVISAVYARTLDAAPDIELVACADVQQDRARTRAAGTDRARARPTDEVLDDPNIELVINLTVPRAHLAVTEAAITAGKAVFSEKPLAIDPADGNRLLALARRHDVLVGCAPDTFLGPGLQTALTVLDSGAIGAPVQATAMLGYAGPDQWHPDPAFLFQEGSGPLLDVGPYFVTALVAGLGPVEAVSGACRKPRSERQVASGPLAGTSFPVTVPTHAVALLEFAGGAVATLVTSFDVGMPYTSSLELHGTAGSLRYPDPNGFDGPVRLRRGPDAEWEDVPLLEATMGDARGIGAIELARSLRSGRQPRASAELAHHVLDVLTAVCRSADNGTRVAVQSTCPQPALLSVKLSGSST